MLSGLSAHDDQVRVVERFLRKNRVDFEILRHRESDGRTSSEAARAWGTTIASVIKSLILLDGHGEALMVLVQGHKRLDLKRTELLTNRSGLRLAHPDEVLQLTGYDVGGIPPIALGRKIQVVVDEGVTGLAWVFGSAGSRYAGLKIKPMDLVRLNNARIGDVTEK